MTNRRYRYVLSILCFSAFAAHAVGATLKGMAREYSCTGDPVKVVGTTTLYKCDTIRGDASYFIYDDGTASSPPLTQHPPALGTASPSRWVSLSNDGTIDIEIDTQRPVGSGAMRSAWFRWSYAAVQTLDPYTYKFHSSIELTYYNCKEQTRATPYAQYYEQVHASGTLVYSVGKAAQPPASEYQQTIPGSYGESLMKYVCGIK